MNVCGTPHAFFDLFDRHLLKKALTPSYFTDLNSFKFTQCFFLAVSPPSASSLRHSGCRRHGASRSAAEQRGAAACGPARVRHPLRWRRCARRGGVGRRRCAAGIAESARKLRGRRRRDGPRCRGAQEPGAAVPRHLEQRHRRGGTGALTRPVPLHGRVPPDMRRLPPDHDQVTAASP